MVNTDTDTHFLSDIGDPMVNLMFGHIDFRKRIPQLLNELMIKVLREQPLARPVHLPKKSLLFW